MEGKEVTGKGDEVLEAYRVESRSDNNPSQFDEPTMPAAADAASPVSVPVLGSEVKKRGRGRPRKYGPDGKVALPLSPMPISSSIPLTSEVSDLKQGRKKLSIKKTHKYEFEGSGERVAYYVGANFTPHIITVNDGEDITMKVMSFSQQESRAICILSANGTISNVSLRQPTSSGGTLTYEGRFEILSLSGSYMPTENGGTKSRSGGMSVSLAGPDGRVMGGGLAGLLVAAGSVQVVVGSFLPGHQQEQKPKKQKTELHSSAIIPINVISADDMKGAYGGTKSIPASSIFFNGDNSASAYPIQSLRNSAADNNISFADESKHASQSKFDVFC